MAQNRTRKIVITGVLGALTVVLGITHWGLIPWFAGMAFTFMQVPAIIGAILEGPIVGAGIGLIFGLFSLIQSAAPTGGGDVLFANPLISVLPRIFIGPIAWLVWRSLKKFPVVGLITSGIVGSITNTVLVLGMIGILKIYPWVVIFPVALTNGIPEAILSMLMTLLIVGPIIKLKIGKKAGASL